MVFEHIEKLKQEYTDQYVIIGHMVPALKRFEGKTGIVRTVNMSGRALVEFLGSTDISWYDIDVDYLKIVAKPPEPVVATKPRKQVAANDATPTKPPPGKARPATTGSSTADILAMARGKKTPEAAAKDATGTPSKKPSPGKKPSTADILAMARGKGSGAEAKGKQPKTDAKALSTAEKLALLRGEKKEDADKPSTSPAKPAPQGDSKKKPSTADILAMARGKRKPVAEEPPQAEAVEPPPEEANRKPSTADILAMARNAKKKPPTDAADTTGNAPPEKPADSTPPEGEDV